VTGLPLEPAYWNWWLVGLVLIIVEILVPGVFFLWIGIAALCVGLMLFLFPTFSWQLQWLLFALLTVGSVSVWWLYLKRHPSPSDEPLLNRRAQQYVGRVFTLEAPIVNGYGKIRVDDSIWKVEAEDCPSGTRVRVVGVDGVVLKAEIEKLPAQRNTLK
jgi:membrane protein implicated in regulation of membrane protease activity